MVAVYRHEPFTDFTVAENCNAFKAALRQVESELGRHHDLLVGGERISTEQKITSVNPANKEEVIGTVSKTNQEIAKKAINAADEAFEAWRKWDAEARAGVLFRAAAIVRRRKFEFAAYLVKEAGKPWKEADGDVAEGIDFMEYYGRQMIALKDGKPVNSRPIEHNRYFYQPMGVTVTISPWNFAFAIMCGTTVAPLVTGNTVLLKPASATPVIAAKFVEVLEEAGVPAGVINYVPGSGAEVGDFLVDHPKVKLITFTGSRDVGTSLWERAAKVHPGQTHLKQVIVEMGGKDTVVVDEDADLDLAAREIIVSAFGFSGQKCSAGSRAVVHQAVYDELLDKVVKLTNDLTVGDPASPDNYMGPVIDQAAYDKIMGYIDIGNQEGRLVAGGTGDDTKGYFIRPTVFADVEPSSRMMQEEIFGPVLAFGKATDFENALDIANNTEYGLTGALITRNRAHMERAREDFHVGNLYFNRNCTGAIVGYHPFGGFKMSGTDSKAGGPDYLTLHMQAKTVSEML